MARLTFSGLKPRVSSQSLSRLSTRLVLVLLFAIAMGLLVGFVEMTWARHRFSREIAEQRVINAENEARVAALKGEAEFRESDVYAEQAAREQLGMAREGDTVLMPTIQVPVPSAPAPLVVPAPSAPSTIDDSLPPNHERWWHAFFPAP